MSSTGGGGGGGATTQQQGQQQQQQQQVTTTKRSMSSQKSQRSVASAPVPGQKKTSPGNGATLPRKPARSVYVLCYLLSASSCPAHSFDDTTTGVDVGHYCHRILATSLTVVTLRTRLLMAVNINEAL